MHLSTRSALLLLCAALSATVFAQDAAHDSKWTQDVKAKIQQQLDDSSKDSIVVFDDHGTEMKNLHVSKYTFEKFDSLSDFVSQAEKGTTSDSLGGVAGLKKDDPIATCQEPKALAPPPQCVLCKDGHRVCAKAAFGRMAKLGDKSQ